MKKKLLKPLFTWIVYSFVILGCDTQPKLDELETEDSFNKDWIFSEDSVKWNKIEIPHTTKIEPLLVNNQWQGDAWYQKKFNINFSNGRKTFLRFEGVMHQANISLNGKEIAVHNGGYSPFCIDISEYAQKGENILQVRVNNENNAKIPPGKALNVLDFNYYGGIYRNVKFLQKDVVYATEATMANGPMKGGQLFHFSDVTDKSAKGQAWINVKNESLKSKEIYVELFLEDVNGIRYQIISERESVSSGADKNISLDFMLEKPLLWSTTHPYLYNVEFKIYANGLLVDELEERIGVRKIELTSKGFFLNGKKIFIRGTNRHQEYPFIGYAMSNEAQYRDAVKIKQAGFDFVRLSHYPQNDAFLEACDELGIMVMDAIPGWQYFEEGEFVENSMQDIKDMVRNDRNHPSVVFWEVSLNESAMTDDYMIKANQALKEELPFEDTYSAGWIDHPSYDLFIPARQHAKAPHYWNNYKDGKRNILIAEYGDWEYYAHNAGFNQKAFQGLKEEERTSRQLRRHGEKRLLQQALNFQEAANSNRQGATNIIGDANWLMFDYNRGYADDLEASGISDIFRLPKMANYFYKSQRRRTETTKALEQYYQPFVKIASYWDKNSPTNLTVYSNCDEVALFLNDELIAKNTPQIDHLSSDLASPPFRFDLGKFTPGKLEAVAYMNNTKVASEIIHTPLKPESIELDIDYSQVSISEERTDYLFVYAKVLDVNGTIVRDTKGQVTFEIKGDGALIGENPVNIEAGIASILLKTKAEFKEIELTAYKNGLGNGRLSLVR